MSDSRQPDRTEIERTQRLLGERFDLQWIIGRGGMASVFRGMDHRLDRQVALKVFRPGFAEGLDPRRATMETRLLAGVNHPSVVSVLTCQVKVYWPALLKVQPKWPCAPTS